MKLYRKLTAICLTAALAAGMAVTASADISPVSVSVNGKTASSSAYINSDWRTMVPAETAKALGVDYSVQGNSVTFTAGSVSQTYTVGEAAGDTVPAMVNGTIYVPFYHLAEAFGYQVGWDRATGSAQAVGSAPEVEPSAEDAVDLAQLEAPAHDASESNQLPLTGYFKASLSGNYANREVRYYIPDTAIIRPYYHFIAVPNQVNVTEFLKDSGWKQIADETGECLYLLLPDQATGVWGAPEAEKDYIAAAKAYHQGNGDYFTTFGEFYLTGYGAGGACLEGWAAENPQLVISQAYLDSVSYGLDNLQAVGKVSYGWKHMTDGDIRDRDGDGVNERLDADGNQKILKQMSDRLKDIVNPDMGSEAGLLKKDDMPVPTWLINCQGADSLQYWKMVNRATASQPDRNISALGTVAVSGGVYQQKDDTWATEYAGRISKVTSITTNAETRSYAFTRALRDAITQYTRYDNSISYGNALTYRLDYTGIQVERYTSPDKRASGTVKGLTLDGDEVSAEISIQSMVVGDGYVSDLLIYVPDTAGDHNIPVVVAWHGGSQTGHLFMDSTAWWQTAAAEGFALALPTRTVHGPGRTTADYDIPLFDKTIEILKADGRFDMGRIYSTGQSMGSVATISVAEERAAYLAAVISSNAGGPSRLSGGDSIPAGLVIGEGNYADRGIPGYAADTSYPEDATQVQVRSSAAATAGADIYWDATKDIQGKTIHNMNDWVDYFTDANGLGKDSLSGVISYSGGNSLNGGHNNVNGSLIDWQTNNARFRTWTWNNEEDIPVMTYIFSLYQAHNCLPGYRPLMWDFLEHYSFEKAEDGTITRYYSPSAFAQDDAVKLS